MSLAGTASVEEREAYASGEGDADTERFGDPLQGSRSPAELRRIFDFATYRDDAVARFSGFFADTVPAGCFHPAPRFRLDGGG